MQSQVLHPSQANAQQLYVINGDGGIGVAYTYRNFTATSQYYGVALTGVFTGAEVYQVLNPLEALETFLTSQVAPCFASGGTACTAGCPGYGMRMTGRL